METVFRWPHFVAPGNTNWCQLWKGKSPWSLSNAQLIPIWNAIVVVIQNRLCSCSFLARGLIITIASYIMICLLFVMVTQIWVIINVFYKMAIASCIMHMLPCNMIVPSFIMTFLFCIGQFISDFSYVLLYIVSFLF